MTLVSFSKLYKLLVRAGISKRYGCFMTHLLRNPDRRGGIFLKDQLYKTFTVTFFFIEKKIKC